MTTNAPLAYTAHPGGAIPPALTPWLTANGINPALVDVGDPIVVLLAPYSASPDGQQLLMHVIVFSQYHVDPSGTPERNLLTLRPVTFQRTIPLQVPLPHETPADQAPEDAEAAGETVQAQPEHGEGGGDE